MSTCLLALDTATEVMAVALCTPTGEWLQQLPGGAQASASVLPAVLALLQAADCPLGQLQAIAFGQGPGAFTGLRTACAVAQGLAFGLDRPVLAIDSLLLLAEDARLASPDPLGPWWVAVDARMDEVYAAQYLCTDVGTATVAAVAANIATADRSSSQVLTQSAARWQVLQPARLYSLAGLAQVWAEQPPQRVAGNALAVFGQGLSGQPQAYWPEAHNRAAALLRLARQAWANGQAQPADQALPLYLRDKVAATTAERAAAASAVAATATAAIAAAQALPDQGPMAGPS